MLCKIENSDCYLYGSIHLLDIEPRLPAAVAQVLERVQRVVLEADQRIPTDTSIFHMRDGKRLTEVAGRTLSNQTIRHWQQLGLDDALLKTMWPAFACMHLGVNKAKAMGYLFQYNIDQHIFNAALAREKQIEFLETPDFQLRIFADAPMQEQIAMLADVAKRNDCGFGRIKKLVAAWKVDEMDEFERQYASEASRTPIFYRALLDDRNRSWIVPIEASVTDKTPTLFAFGMLHFAGQANVAKILAARGHKLSYQSTPLG